MTGLESLRCGPLSACSHFFTPGVRPVDQAPQPRAATSWPYQFTKLSPEDRHTRRLLLDQYGLYAQLSALVLFFMAVVLRLALQSLGRVVQRRAMFDVESKLRSPGIPKHYLRRLRLSAKLCRLRWWLGGNVKCFGTNIGQRDELVLGVLWTGWLLFLCLHRTGSDYHHLARRFGIVGVSQFPIQYLLATKRFNPIALALGTSHERINPWHRGLGWISSSFLAAHGLLYLNFYVQVGGLGAAVSRPVPVLGMLALSGMTLLGSTSTAFVRRHAYRVFFFTHAIVVSTVPVLVWFHSHHGWARLFVAEALGVFVFQRVVRNMGVKTLPATLTKIPGTNLVRIVARAPPELARHFKEAVGSHAYLSIPRAGSTSQRLHPASFLSNPFTVASVSPDFGELTFVARQMHGPVTTSLGSLASLQASAALTTVCIGVDGPYGNYASFLKQLQYFDRVLLVAGGVGATAILPLYRHIRTAGLSTPVKFLWVVREASELMWAGDILRDSAGCAADGSKVRLFVTRGERGVDVSESGNEAPGLEFPKQLDDISSVHAEDEIEKGATGVGTEDIRRVAAMSLARPDLQSEVDEMFGEDPDERVAVVVCGPATMVDDLRSAVGFWVEAGRDVYFDKASFSL